MPATNAFDKGFETDDLDDFTIFDYRLDIPFFKNSVMSIGKQKEPISLERLTGGTFLPNQERAAVSDALLPSRNVGIVWNGSSPGKYSSWAIGAFNDWFDASEDFDESATQYVGRITWAPLVSEDESNLVHLGAGYRYSNAKQGFHYKTEPEFNKSPLFVDTEGPHPADKTETYNLEFAWRKGPFTLSSEYTQVDVKNPGPGEPHLQWILCHGSMDSERRNTPLLQKKRCFRRNSGRENRLPERQGRLGIVHPLLRYRFARRPDRRRGNANRHTGPELVADSFFHR